MSGRVDVGDWHGTLSSLTCEKRGHAAHKGEENRKGREEERGRSLSVIERTYGLDRLSW